MTNGKMNTECNMKTLKIYCDGGFGNRFNALSVGLLIAKVGNFKPVILWPSTNWCRSLFQSIFKNEYEVFEQWRLAKANLVSKHQTWIDTITKQCDQLKIGLKAYRYLSEGIELANELGIQLDEAELIRTNSTGLTIYNPSNLANLIKGMKNKNVSREDKIKARIQYEKQSVN